MRREDIELRDAARRGVPQACVALAAKLFSGRHGLARNVRLGLAYLQQELDRQSPVAQLLAAEAVPLDMLAAHQLLAVLEQAATRGSSVAMLKLGAWLGLTRERRDEGPHWVRRSGQVAADWTGESITDCAHWVAVLQLLTPAQADAGAVAITAAERALASHDVAQACFCIRVAAGLMAPDARLATLVLACVRRSATSGAPLDLPVDLVEQCLYSRSEQGEVEAQYGLGCALAGAPYGRLKPQWLARAPNLDLAASLLLRAADAGQCQAWLTLSEMVPGFKSAIRHRGMARYFLEKAARAGLAQAQTRLGAVLLREAATLDDAEAGLHWLHAAASQAEPQARQLLETLLLPLPVLPAAYEQSLLARVSALDREIGVRLALARALHLTRHEAMHFHAAHDLRPWGLRIAGTTKENPKGRLAPAVSPAMQAELQRAAAFFAQASPIDASLALQRGRAQRQVFRLLAIRDELVFAPDIGRSWSHYGYGRHWGARAASLLDQVLASGEGTAPRTSWATKSRAPSAVC